MSGVGIGAFAQGLAGGLSLGKAFKDGGKKKEDAAKPATDQQVPGFGLGQPLVSGDAGTANIAGSQPATATATGSTGGTWDFLSGILGSIGNNSNMGA